MSNDVTKPRDREALVTQLRRGQRPSPPERPGAAERAAQRDASMAKIRANADAQVIARDFIAAKRAEVDSLETLARELLAKHLAPKEWPREGSAEEAVELEWRELAHASRQLRPLLEALERANAKDPDFEKYKDGFDFRLTEAMTTVATLCAHRRLDTIRQKKAARKERPKAESPILRFIRDYLKRRPNAKPDQVKTALLNKADDVQWEAFDLSDDRSEIISPEDHDPDEGPRFHLKVSGIPAAISKIRKKNSLPLTG